MSDYQMVQRALAAGADPAMLCTTCPWDRNCITPPAVTSGDIDKAMLEARETTGSQQEKGAAVLMTTLILGGRDTAMQACPVFTLRLRSSDGRKIAEAVRGLMQAWEDS